MKLSVLIGALKVGNELPNPTTVKWYGLAVTAFSLVLTFVGSFALSKGWLSEVLTPSDIYQLSGLLVASVLTALGYVQTATTKKIGVGSIEDDSSDSVPDSPDVVRYGSVPPNNVASHKKSAKPTRTAGPFLDI